MNYYNRNKIKIKAKQNDKKGKIKILSSVLKLTGTS